MLLTIPREIIEAARSGERERMECLLRALWPHAYRIARSIVQDDLLAEDAAQEACALIYRELSRLRSADAFRVWVYRIVAREALRLAKRDIAHHSIAEKEPSAPDVDARLDLLHAIATLPPPLRAAVVLHYYADLSSNEIGRVLRIPAATVRFRLAKARRRLLDALGSEAPLTTALEFCHEQ